MNDYANEGFIDKRIVEICRQAERNYIISQSPNEFGNKIIIPTQTRTTTQKTDDIHNDIKKFEYNSNIGFPQLKLSQENNKNFETIDISKKSTRRKNNSSVSMTYRKERTDQNIIQTINESVQMKMPSSLTDRSLPFKSNHDHINNSMNLSISSISSSSSCCLECEIKKLIEDKHCYNAELNKFYVANKYINNILLKSKSFLSKNEPQKAYTLLYNEISNNIIHPDLFYLYGDCCRLLKKMEESEKYLLLSLNFTHCSPYVMYSLGLLYNEVHQWKYSNIFLKRFLSFSEGSYIRYLIASNYHQMNKDLKAVDQITKGIESNDINSKHLLCDYYDLRAEIYKKIGQEELALKDTEVISYMKRKEVI